MIEGGVAGRLSAATRVTSAARGAGFAIARSPVIVIVVRRLLVSVPLLFVVSAMSFLLVSLTPGDPAREILGQEATIEQYASLREELGLELPVWEQYARWARDAVVGDLGRSIYTSQDVSQAITDRLPVTASLIAGSLLLVLILGVGFGIVSAARGGVIARLVDAISLAGFALPSYWVGAMLIVVFAIELKWFPVVGYVPLSDSPTDWVRSLTLPVIALGLHGIAAVAKQTREALLDALGSEYVRMAWANGISPRSIFFRHALKNASIRVVTVLGLTTVGLLGGTVFVESVFGLPGLGGLAVESTRRHDLPMVQGIGIYFTVIVVLVNLFIDILYGWLNPRVRTS